MKENGRGAGLVLGFTRDTRLYKTFFPLLIIISLQQLASILVNLVDNVMLGRYTEVALSGATLVNQYQFVLQQLAAGIGMGIVVLAGQYWGKKELEPIRRIIGLGIKMGLAAGLVFLALALAVPEFMLGLLTDSQPVIDEGVKYLRILCFTYPIFGLSNSLMYALQSVETVMVGTLMSVSTVCINVCLNYCLIYGNFGAPELGVEGAAIATLISRIVELAIILFYVLKVDRKLRMKVRDLLRVDLSFLGSYVKVAAPLMASGFFWGIAQAVQTSILGHLTPPAIAANSICAIIFHLLGVFGMSCASASSVTIAKTIGEGNMDRVKPYSISLQLIFILIGLVSGLAIFLSRDFVVGLYNTLSPEATQLTYQFLTVLSVTTVFSCYQYPVASGIVAGGGDTKYPAIVENLFMWLWVIPLSWLCAFAFKVPPVWVFICLKSDQVLKCIPNSIKCNRFRWARELTR